MEKNILELKVNNKDNPKYAHPYFWAPFVVVGEGNEQRGVGRIRTLHLCK